MPIIFFGKPKKRDRTVNKQLCQRIYQDPRWRRLRAEKFKNDPLCEECEKRDIVKQAEEVHHKIPFETGRTPGEIEALAFDYDNLQSLCVKCHKKADRKFKMR